MVIVLNLIDYVKKHGNETFKDKEFNDVDALLLSLLPYIDFEGIVPAFKKGKVLLKNINLHSIEKIKKQPSFVGNTRKVFELLKTSKRYQDILLYNYMYIVNDEMQFGALTMKMPDKSVYVAFAGTDSSIVGWEEDFKMAYLYPGASQKYANIYLKQTIKLFDMKVRVGGHSKGGNLAISSAMNSKFFLKKRICQIYNFDGPGFLKEQTESQEYKSVQKKIKMYVPEESIIGMILYHTEDYVVVKAKGFSILQHDAFNWALDDNGFIKSKQNKKSKNIEKKLTQKLEELSIPARLKLVQDVFNLFKQNDIKDTKDIKIKSIFGLIKSFSQLDSETQSLFRQFLFILLLS